LGWKFAKRALHYIANNSAYAIRKKIFAWIGIEEWPSKIVEELVFIRVTFSPKSDTKDPLRPQNSKIKKKKTLT
jgi:hypothetical protein